MGLFKWIFKKKETTTVVDGEQMRKDKIKQKYGTQPQQQEQQEGE